MAENVIPDCQFGFLPGRSTVWQLLSVMEEWQQAMDDGLIVHALFLDISKAFDRVDHNLLLENSEPSVCLSLLSAGWPAI